MSDDEFRESLSFTKYEDEHIAVVKQIDKVYKNDHCDIYTKETVTEKSTGETYPVSGTTDHKKSGWHNEKYYGSDNTTHVNNCGPNQYIFDQDNETGERTNWDAEMSRK